MEETKQFMENSGDKTRPPQKKRKLKRKKKTQKQKPTPAAKQNQELPINSA